MDDCRSLGRVNLKPHGLAMSAWKQNAPNERWFRVDAAALTYSLMKDECKTQHEKEGCGLLSVALNVAGTEAIVKVAGAGDWKPSFGTVIKTYTPDTLPDLQKLCASTLWRKPASK